MEFDDEIRDKVGAVICIRELADGRSRVILDDVDNLSETGRGDWKHHSFVTWKDYETETLRNLNLTEKELADFGHYVLTRILASKKVLA